MAHIKDHNSATNVRKMTCNNPKLDLVNMNAYIKFGKKMPVSSQDIERKRNFGCKSKAITLVHTCEKMTFNNPKLDLAKMNAYIKFGEILPIGSQDIERKQNFGANNEFPKNDV